MLSYHLQGPSIEFQVTKFTSEVSNYASEASKPSAGASWQRPAIGQPTSASRNKGQYNSKMIANWNLYYRNLDCKTLLFFFFK